MAVTGRTCAVVRGLLPQTAGKILKCIGEETQPNRSFAHLAKHVTGRYLNYWSDNRVTAHAIRCCQTSQNPAATPPGESRNIDPTASRQFGMFYFDTLAMVKRLTSQGYNQEQAEALTQELVDVVSAALDHQNKSMVTKPQQEIMVQQLLAHIAAVKKDMVILEKSEFTMIRNDTEKQSIQIEQLNTRLGEEVKKLAANVALDINLEKSRAKEAHAINEKDLQKLNNRIDIEISNLKTQFEKYRNDAIKYSLGLLMTIVTVVLGILRLYF